MRTIPVASLRRALAFNTRPRRLSTPLLTPLNSTPTIARVERPEALEDCPAVYDEDGLFDTSIVPWWVWVKRFHLPEAEKINGRAAMVGYAFAYLIDAAGGAGLVDLHQSFLGKTAIFVTVAFCLFVRRLDDLDTLGVLADEATFYDKQWNATWEGKERPSDNK